MSIPDYGFYKFPLGHPLQKTNSKLQMPLFIYRCFICVSAWTHAYSGIIDDYCFFKFYPEEQRNIHRKIDKNNQIEYISELDDKPLTDNKEIT